MLTDSDTFKIKTDECEKTSSSYESREIVLSKLDRVIEFLHHKALEGRVKNPENDKVRIQWFKAMIYACSIYNQIKRDVEYDQLNEKVEELEIQIKELNGGYKN